MHFVSAFAASAKHVYVLNTQAKEQAWATVGSALTSAPTLPLQAVLVVGLLLIAVGLWLCCRRSPRHGRGMSGFGCEDALLLAVFSGFSSRSTCATRNGCLCCGLAHLRSSVLQDESVDSRATLWRFVGACRACAKSLKPME